MHIKVKALGHGKKNVNEVVSSGTTRQIHNLVSLFEVDGGILGNLE